MLNFPYILSKRRSEYGKIIRRQYKGDKGVPYQLTKQYQLNRSGVCDCITTFTTDNNIINKKNTIMGKELTYHPSPTKEDLLEYFGQRIRIRKMTPREAFRLQDVDDADIDKIQACPFKTLEERAAAIAAADKQELARIRRESICKTAQYKLAGNSITCSVLFHIFRKLFIDKESDAVQLSLFDFVD